MNKKCSNNVRDYASVRQKKTLMGRRGDISQSVWIGLSGADYHSKYGLPEFPLEEAPELFC